MLLRYGTAAQKQEWLAPILSGDIRSCFAMTEPHVASSDATNIEVDWIRSQLTSRCWLQCRIERDGDSYVVSGRKWCAQTSAVLASMPQVDLGCDGPALQDCHCDGQDKHDGREAQAAVDGGSLLRRACA